ncbi:MAG: cation-translocating P-type ATPase [Spirochaetales bacterium]|nr:cation-translocating P-type ATPase [Spirochaetales bacterium]
MDFYNKNIDQALKELDTSREHGLSQHRAEALLAKHGKNELVEKGRKGIAAILFDQVKEIMVIILFVAAVISFFLHEVLDAIVIFIIIILNTILGFWQEFKAEKAISALKKLSVPYVRVKRDGKVREISATELVIGDIILIEAGNIIPADARLIESANLRIQESTLTGESEPVEKVETVITTPNLTLGDRKNMVYMGTIVTFGRGTGVVTATGMNTELGKIATMLQDVEEDQTPLQKRLANLGGALAAAALILIIIVAGISALRQESAKVMFMTAISMAVAAIPEGLPAVVTIALALGARKMLKNKSLIRNLPSVETLGSVTVICSDKTGTLTQNKMTVTDAVLPHTSYSMEDVIKIADKPGNEDLSLLLVCGSLCNDAILTFHEGFALDRVKDAFDLVGDPTEGALIVAAEKIGLNKETIEKTLPRVAELPFSSDRKRMTTVHTPGSGINTRLKKIFEPVLFPDKSIVITKGSADGLLEISNRVVDQGKVMELTPAIKEKLLSENARLAGNGIRVLGIAIKSIEQSDMTDTAHYEEDLIFVGMTGMIDPVRPEAIQAVATCKKAGIRPVMITGDHPLTALHIAKELGITNTDKCITGQQLSMMSFIDLETITGEASVYARVSPEHKMKLINALQNRGHIVAMTGDGVNDAPALKSADIGVSMGITGTDVAKQSSDMVLLDDNFATIVAAVKEGRTIYDNIKKFIKYILTGNAGEILVMLVGPLFGMPLALLPIQILWINLVTDGAPGIALGYELPEKDSMNRPPYKPKESLFSRGVGRQILWVGFLVAALSLGVGFYFYSTLGPKGPWQTTVFTTLTFCQMIYAFCVRSNKASLFSQNPFSNPILTGAIITTIGLQFALIYVPFFQGIFKTVALSSFQLLVCSMASLVILVSVEIEKFILRLLERH